MRCPPRGNGGAPNPVLLSAGFRDCADFEVFRRFRILRDLVQPNPSTQLDIFRDFDEKLRLGAAESAEVSPPRRSGAILRAVVTVRCPATTLVLGTNRFFFWANGFFSLMTTIDLFIFS